MALVQSPALRDLTWRRRVQIVLFCFPVLCAAAALLFGVEAAVYAMRSVTVQGVVVHRYDRPGETIFDRGTLNYEPVFTYQIDGESYRASVGSGHASFYFDLGATAPIRVIPGARGNVRLDTWQGMWFLPVILSALAAAALLLAGAIWWALARTVFRKDLT